MTTEIVVAIIGALGASIGAFIGSQKTTAVMQEQIKDIKEDITDLSSRVQKEINTLSTRVDKHNNLVERMAKVEVSVENLKGAEKEFRGVR